MSRDAVVGPAWLHLDLSVAAAIGGVLAPLGVYLAVSAVADGDVRGWAIPVATDLAFALAVLAVIVLRRRNRAHRRTGGLASAPAQGLLG